MHLLSCRLVSHMLLLLLLLLLQVRECATALVHLTKELGCATFLVSGHVWHVRIGGGGGGGGGNRRGV
jgi:hypothetical protein